MSRSYPCVSFNCIDVAGGPKPFALNFVIGGVMLGMIEGVGHMFSAAFAQPHDAHQQPLLKTSIGANDIDIYVQRVSFEVFVFIYCVSISLYLSCQHLSLSLYCLIFFRSLFFNAILHAILHAVPPCYLFSS